MGGLRTLTTSPGFTMRAGLACAPLMQIRPFLQASEAMVRVLKMRTAHIHLSILASAILLLVKLVHGDVDSCQTEALHDLSGGFQTLVHGLHVLVSFYAVCGVAEKYGVILDEKALERFDIYARLLVEWNEKINLTAITEENQVYLKQDTAKA